MCLGVRFAVRHKHICAQACALHTNNQCNPCLLWLHPATASVTDDDVIICEKQNTITLANCATPRCGYSLRFKPSALWDYEKERREQGMKTNGAAAVWQMLVIPSDGCAVTNRWWQMCSFFFPLHGLLMKWLPIYKPHQGGSSVVARTAPWTRPRGWGPGAPDYWAGEPQCNMDPTWWFKGALHLVPCRLQWFVSKQPSIIVFICLFLRNAANLACE